MTGVGIGVRRRKNENSSSTASMKEREGGVNSLAPTMSPHQNLPTLSDEVANLGEGSEEINENVDGEGTEVTDGGLEFNGEDGLEADGEDGLEADGEDELGADVDGMETGNEVEVTDTEIGGGVLNMTTQIEPAEIIEPSTSFAHATPSKSSFDYGEDILVWFSVGNNTSPQDDDWITLFSLGTGQDSASMPWLYTCNQVSVCDGPVPRNGSVVFNEDAAGVWPQPPGDYRPFLYRGQEPPFQILASGPILKIREP